MSEILTHHSRLTNPFLIVCNDPLEVSNQLLKICSEQSTDGIKTTRLHSSHYDFAAISQNKIPVEWLPFPLAKFTLAAIYTAIIYMNYVTCEDECDNQNPWQKLGASWNGDTLATMSAYYFFFQIPDWVLSAGLLLTLYNTLNARQAEFDLMVKPPGMPLMINRTNLETAKMTQLLRSGEDTILFLYREGADGLDTYLSNHTLDTGPVRISGHYYSNPSHPSNIIVLSSIPPHGRQLSGRYKIHTIDPLSDRLDRSSNALYNQTLKHYFQTICDVHFHDLENDYLAVEEPEDTHAYFRTRPILVGRDESLQLCVDALDSGQNIILFGQTYGDGKTQIGKWLTFARPVSPINIYRTGMNSISFNRDESYEGLHLGFQGFTSSLATVSSAFIALQVLGLIASRIDALNSEGLSGSVVFRESLFPIVFGCGSICIQMATYYYCKMIFNDHTRPNSFGGNQFEPWQMSDDSDITPQFSRLNSFYQAGVLFFENFDVYLEDEDHMESIEELHHPFGVVPGVGIYDKQLTVIATTNSKSDAVQAFVQRNKAAVIDVSPLVLKQTDRERFRLWLSQFMFELTDRLGKRVKWTQEAVQQMFEFFCPLSDSDLNSRADSPFAPLEPVQSTPLFNRQAINTIVYDALKPRTNGRIPDVIDSTIISSVLNQFVTQ